MKQVIKKDCGREYQADTFTTYVDTNVVGVKLAFYRPLPWIVYNGTDYPITVSRSRAAYLLRAWRSRRTVQV